VLPPRQDLNVAAFAADCCDHPETRGAFCVMPHTHAADRELYNEPSHRLFPPAAATCCTSPSDTIVDIISGC
jgi:hypothetical protein